MKKDKPKTVRVIIAGSRTFLNRFFLFEKMDEWLKNYNRDDVEVVWGGAKGADIEGKNWANSRGVPHKLFKADWVQHDKAAGPIRNREMAEYATHLVLFWDGRSSGSANMLSEAKKRKLKIGAFVVDSELMSMPPHLTVSCVYFRQSGKWYINGSEQFPKSLFEGCIYPRDYGARLNSLGKLPGLNTGRWAWYFTVSIEGGDCGEYTELVGT